MNTTNSEIYHLKEDLKALEYNLMEEQFHYKSIPDRRKSEKINKILYFIFILLNTLTFIRFLSFAIKNMQTELTPVTAVLSYIAAPLICVLTGGMDYILITRYLNEYVPGFHSSRHFHAAALSEEEKKSAEKIRELTTRINEIRHRLEQLSASVEACPGPAGNSDYLTPSLSMSPAHFFRYAYGTWGLRKEDLLFKFSLGSYQEEKQKLTEEINDTNAGLSRLALQIADIDNLFFDTRQLLLFYHFAQFCMLLIFLAYMDLQPVRLTVLLIAFLLIFPGIRIRRKYKMARIKYLVEHYYAQNRGLADQYNLTPVSFRKEALLTKLGWLKQQLQFVTFLLEYMNMHPEIN